MAQTGIAAGPRASGVPIGEFADLAAWCKDWCEASGDSRYCVVGEIIRMIDVWWGEQGVPTVLVGRLSEVLTSRLPAVLNEEDASDGATLATSLREAVGPLLLSPDEWVTEGYASRGGEEL